MLGEKKAHEDELFTGFDVFPSPASTSSITTASHGSRFSSLSRQSSSSSRSDTTTFSHRPLTHTRFQHPARIPPSKKNNLLVSRNHAEAEAQARKLSIAARSSTKAWLAYRVVGGLRADPFNAFPVEPKDCVPSAVDHFIQIFIPERILRPFGAVPEIEQLAKDYFHLALSDECVFESIIAQAQASYVAQQAIRKPTKEVLHHHGRALALLQEKLADPVECTSDATFHSILGIMSTHFFFGELKEHQAHLDGLWALVHRRGGLETLGWNGTLAQSIETVTSFRAYAATVETAEATPEPTGPGLQYPSHPFSSDLCESIAKLPEGFGELALKNKLSYQLIDLIGEIQSRHDRYSDTDMLTARTHIYEADKCLELLKSSQLVDLERMICAGLLAYAVHSQSPLRAQSQSQSASTSSASSPSPPPSNQNLLPPLINSRESTPPSLPIRGTSPYLSPDTAVKQGQSPASVYSYTPPPPPSTSVDQTLRTTFYDDSLKTLVSEFAQYTFFNYEDEVLVWITYTFASMQSYLMRDRRDFFHHTLMRFRQSTNWINLERVLKKYFWSDKRLMEWRDAWDEVRRVHRPQLVQSSANTPSPSPETEMTG